MIFSGILYSLKIFHMVGRWILSKAFWKSTKFRYKFHFHSMHCSTMFPKINICSVQDQPFWNPAGSFRSCPWIAYWILVRWHVNTLDTKGSKVTPLKLLQSVTSPFFESFVIRPFCQSLGNFSYSQMDSNRVYSTSVARSTFSSSAGILSYPGALWFFNFLIACLTSALEGTYMYLQVDF